MKNNGAVTKSGGGTHEAQHSGSEAQGQHAHGHQQHGDPDHFDLAQAALDEMHEAGFQPEFGPGVAEQVEEIRTNLAAEFKQGAAGVWCAGSAELVLVID